MLLDENVVLHMADIATHFYASEFYILSKNLSDKMLRLSDKLSYKHSVQRFSGSPIA